MKFSRRETEEVFLKDVSDDDAVILCALGLEHDSNYRSDDGEERWIQRKLHVDTELGRLYAEVYSRGDYPSVNTYFTPKGTDIEVPLHSAEVQDDGCIHVYDYHDIMFDEPTDVLVIEQKSIDEMVEAYR